MNTNLQNAVSTLNGLSSIITSAEASIASAQSDIDALNAQIVKIQSAKTFANLEFTPALVAGGSSANSTGNTGVAGDAQTIPGTNFASRTINPNGAYQDKYFYWKLGADATKDTFSYSAMFMLTNPSAPQALELDIQQVVSNVCFNTGFQFDFAENKLRIWNRSPLNHGWLATGVVCPRWAAGTWHSVVLNTHRDAQNVYYDNMVVDGVSTPLSQFTFPSIPLSNSDMINCAIQLDANSTGVAYTAFINSVNMVIS